MSGSRGESEAEHMMELLEWRTGVVTRWAEEGAPTTDHRQP